ncbi:MAG: ABC transporter ATP-binding protein, partial [Oxalobacteraceae bacterium]
MPQLTLNKLCKAYGKATVVDDLDLALAQGELVSLLGPSGCGKTTTLRMIAGFIDPTSGTVEVDGKVLSSARGSVPPERRGMSMIFQSYAIWPNMTVAENVGFGLAVRKVAAAEDAHRLFQFRVQRAQAGAGGGGRDRQEARDVGQHDQPARAVQRKRRAGIGRIEAHGQDDAWHRERRQRHELDQSGKRQQPPLRDIGDHHAEHHAGRRRGQRIQHRVEHGLAHGHLLEEDVMEIRQRQVGGSQALAPRLGKCRLQQDAQRQHHREHADEPAIRGQHPFERPDVQRPPFAALARHRHVALLGQQPALQQEQHHRCRQHRHRIG